VNPIQVFYAIAVGVVISVLGQMVVDWWRRRNAVVSIEDFERLESKFNKLVIKLERQGIQTNGD
jgi:hypothetical protein